ncbi:MAG TPA: hypothetical protein VG897_08905 [Terriglobales bacterium]|nr:hypothetical protein [Terriglobales bacterium]
MESATVYILLDDDPVTVIVGNNDVTVIGPDLPGPPGPQGPQGPSGGSTFTRIAAQALSGQRVVKAVPGGKVDYASADQSGDALLIEGITTGAASSGAEATVQSTGEMTDVAWSWALGPVFCGLNGQLTQAPPNAAWICQIGLAIDATTIVIGIRPPIFTP